MPILFLATAHPNVVERQTSIFKRYLDGIDWDALFAKSITIIILLILSSIAFFILHSIGKKIIKNSFKRNLLKGVVATGRMNTAYTLIQNIFHYTVLFLYIYTVLSILGIPVGTLIAGAGLASVAIGLGAQGFVTDIVTGIFILMEQQYVVGDYVKIGTVTGTVHAFGLRTTQIISDDGTLIFIPNRSITIVNNQSRHDMRALVDVRIDPNQKLSEMKEIIEEVNTELRPKYPDISQDPKILGTVDTPKGLALRVAIFCKAGAQFQIQRDFLAAYLTALTEAGFEIPASPLNLAPEGGN
ncbi:potassium efflux system kefa protein small-conductance mechanosensitive channel [Ligilactobacillus hayakitensis DSM 18933 = JCM 14209]|uniref:Potassium efflux system kefa protein small-conductance mechanosensitive channel n=1 Tax=Ligilactobacillus hayakitensis DSM 18933 = JCM 14209 TaxID=1423755 RepID=A0A0R1X0D4_9LACO|nr:mechanosensitive ion channel family protein [Ligilactobacillus hayakitensis]KRM19884.1 potassium efflux system kefa protein small-conductance mechanosensitive channel [Ligilactobacillus hayakitensis DSM 18933 = JCM 14209]